MPRPLRRSALCATLLLLASARLLGLTGEPYVTFAPQPGSFALVTGGHAAAIYTDDDQPGVQRVARDLQADIERVTAIRPILETGAQPAAANAVIVGAIGHSPVIDALIHAGKLDVSAVRGQWESWVRAVVEHPTPNIARALVIAGSDKRGTLFGTYDLSEQIGVSPWYWWADVMPTHHPAVYVSSASFVQGPPSVKYRGIFLNDEAPDLTNWVRAKFGEAPVRASPPVPPGVANYGHEFYARIFEVLLRLRGNYLWPAMWANAFNEDDPENARLADEYGIVMGTSHQEPMLRAQKEWDRRYLKTIGTWNYATDPERLEQFWREGVHRNRGFESIVTLGLRGANDTEMAPGGPAANRVLLEHIVERQRAILREEVNPDLTRVPQLWCLYKEVQDYYEAGMRVPDDITLLWADDNWGNVRRLPTSEEPRRPGGAGVYYHFDYHGGPRSYQWINTNPLPKIWEQMSLAKAYGADRIWIVNVGHFKGYEVPTEFFLDLAWNPNRWTAANVNDFLLAWATREFGAEHAREIAAIVAGYAKYNARRKPELLSPSTYSLLNYHEAETVVADFNWLRTHAERLYAVMAPEKRDAFYELVLFPTKASALVNDLYWAAGRNALHAAQGRASATIAAAETRRHFAEDLALMDYFNHAFAGGRWAHFMDQTHLGYTTWRDPPKNSLDAIKLVDPPAPTAGALGVSVEGDTAAWPLLEKAVNGSGTAKPPRLPEFDSINQQRRYIEVFNRGATAFPFTVTSSAPWVQPSMTSGSLGSDTRIWVTMDWNRAPAGVGSATLTVTGAGAMVDIAISTRRVPSSRAQVRGFVENAGVISIEPEHATATRRGATGQWVRVADYGRTLSGMRAEPLHAADPDAWARDALPASESEPSWGRDAPVAFGSKATAEEATRASRPQSDTYPKDLRSRPDEAAMLEYRLFTFSAGPVEVTAITSPTLNFLPGRGLRYAVSIDDERPQVVALVPPGYQAQNGNRDWEKTVADNARYATSHHVLAHPGFHTLRVWMVDPAVVLQKLVVNLGGLRPSYLGPPESFHRSP